MLCSAYFLLTCSYYSRTLPHNLMFSTKGTFLPTRGKLGPDNTDSGPHLPPNFYFKLSFILKFLNKTSTRILRDIPFVRSWTFHLCHFNEIPGSMSHFWRTIPGIYLKGTNNNSPREFFLEPSFLSQHTHKDLILTECM